MQEGNEKSFQDRLIDFTKKNFVIFALFFGGVVLIAVGLVQMTGQKTASIKFEKGIDVAGASASQGEALQKIKVDVEGQVLKPGVYSLNSDARVQDALIAAGGLSSKANRNAINLAAKITDGQKIYVPAEGEEVSVSNLGGSGVLGDLGGSGVPGLVSVNSATQAELEELPGVGPVTAQKIIDTRPYGSVEELLSKKAVGKATWEKIKDLVSL